MGDGRNHLEDTYNAVSGGALAEGGKTNLEDGENVDVENEVRSLQKRPSGPDAVHISRDFVYDHSILNRQRRVPTASSNSVPSTRAGSSGT